MKRLAWLILASALLLGLPIIGASCAGKSTADDDAADDDISDDDSDFQLTSDAFSDGENIPAKYTCDNDDPDDGLSPPLEWANAPSGTVAFALTVTDPDAGDCAHWGLINIPSNVSSLAEGISPDGALPSGAWETKNYTGKVGYAGPCPPESDDAHHYEFTLHAMSASIPDPDNDLELDSIISMINSVTLETATLTGVYKR